tara:strand:+ start:515 stop:733 length:219 start_codon:yes stop_codon:yes gene_type:complete
MIPVFYRTYLGKVMPGQQSAPTPIPGDAVVTDTGSILFNGTSTIVSEAIYLQTSSAINLTDGTNQIVHIQHG